jgi:hypothetical protein
LSRFVPPASSYAIISQQTEKRNPDSQTDGNDNRGKEVRLAKTHTHTNADNDNNS